MPARHLSTWMPWAISECLLVLLLVGIAPAVAFDPPQGFGGIKWGSPIVELGDQFTLVDERGDGTFYARKDDRLKIGDAEVTGIIYGFYKHRFYYVSVRFSRPTDFRAIKDNLFEAYGPGERPRQDMEQYFWDSAEVFIMLGYSEVSQRGRLVYFYNPIAEQQTADEKARAKEEREDL
jgi:hypothetical protein